jgi:TRAP-type C4-dicarboxylate transport system substrate-binding protein
MSTFVIPVDKKQKKVLKSILEYLNLPFQEVEADKDFWQELSPSQKKDIEEGIAEAAAAKTKPWREVLSKFE